MGFAAPAIWHLPWALFESSTMEMDGFTRRRSGEMNPGVGAIFGMCRAARCIPARCILRSTSHRETPPALRHPPTTNGWQWVPWTCAIPAAVVAPPLLPPCSMHARASPQYPLPYYYALPAVSTGTALGDRYMRARQSYTAGGVLPPRRPRFRYITPA